jgi:hypothetical protein
MNNRKTAVTRWMTLALCALVPAACLDDGTTLEGELEQHLVGGIVLMPSSDVDRGNVKVDGSSTQLFTNLDDGSSFALADGSTTDIRNGWGITKSQYTAGMTAGPSSPVTTAAIYFRARAEYGVVGSIQMVLFQGSTQVAASPVRTLAQTWTNFTETFSGLTLTSGRDLRVKVLLTAPTTGYVRVTQLWVEVATSSAPPVDGGSPGADAGSPSADAGTIIAKGASWRFLDNGSDQGTAWRGSSFDDSAWKTGAAELGYGDGDEATVISYGPSSSSKYTTSYFRREFSLTMPSQYTSLRVALRRDDGAVVYLNGAEVFRSNMPSGTVTAATFAFGAQDENADDVGSVSASLLKAGVNVIAVEVHQSDGSSSDLSFDLELVGVGGGSCTPTTCAAQGKNCGTIADGCGGTLACGICSSPQTCGGGGTVNVCGGGIVSSGDPILVGAGDISICGSANGEPTAKILDALFANGANSNGVIFTAGDNAYEDGTLSEYQNCYGPTWGRHKSRTRPSPGNHERDVTASGGYFQYFGSNAGDPSRGAYYSYDLGKWHIVVLDTYGTSVSSGSTQDNWLKADLAAHPAQCTLAYFHAPRFSSGNHGSASWMQSIWQTLYNANVDVVLSGHDHHYERFAPQTPAGSADSAKGIRQFLVGTGGATLYSMGSALPNSEVRYNGGYGLLKLTLHDSSYDWEFLNEAGKSFKDTGTGACH